MKAYLIDDEPAIPAILEKLLTRYCPEVRVVGKSYDWEMALQQIPLLQPDVVFLDIRMPKGTGFEFLEKMGPDRSFQVVFVTGHSDHAIQALKAEATDYLVKPIDFEELIQAVERVKRKLEQIQTLTSEEGRRFLFVHVADSILQIPLGEVLYLEADNNYTRIATKNQGVVLVARTLKEFELQLEDQTKFNRISRSVIVNSDFIVSYSKTSPYQIEMQNQARFDITRRKKQGLMERGG